MIKYIRRSAAAFMVFTLFAVSACGASQQNADASASPDASASASVQASQTPKPSVKPSASATPTRTLDPFEEAIKAGNYEFLLEPTPTPTPTPSATPRPSASPSSSASASSSPSSSASATASSAASSSPSVSAPASQAPAQTAQPPGASVYTGSGDASIPVTPPEGDWVLYATGNSAGKFFSIQGLNAQGQPTQTFVDTTAKYRGVTYDPTKQTSSLNIKATGDWTVQLLPFSYLWTVSPEQPFKGRGDDVIKISTQGDWVLYVNGNAVQKYFMVKGYNSAGEGTEMFVNTAEKYRGVTYDPSQQTALITVNATGDWTAEILPLSYLWTVSKGEMFNGNGDDVIKIGSGVTGATISGNNARQQFDVLAYGNGVNELLVNTTEPYNGAVPINGNPQLMVVKANGAWSAAMN